MKKLIWILVFVVAAYAGQAFNQGYRDGWKAGNCYGRGYGCYPGYPPYPPYPDYGEDTYMAGYNRGFIDGINAQ